MKKNTATLALLASLSLVGACKKSAAPAASTVKAIPAGKVIVGYMKDNSDDSMCATLVDKPENKAKFEKEGAEIAKALKGTLVDSCPAVAVVGTCNAGFGLLVNYSGPKWTADSASQDCTKNHGTWVN